MNHEELLSKIKNGYRPTVEGRREIIRQLKNAVDVPELGRLLDVSPSTIYADLRLLSEKDEQQHVSSNTLPDALQRIVRDHEENMRAIDESLAATKPGTQTYKSTIGERAKMQIRVERLLADFVAKGGGSREAYHYKAYIPEGTSSAVVFNMADMTAEQLEKLKPAQALQRWVRFDDLDSREQLRLIESRKVVEI